MALEDNGISINVDALKKKLQERFPNHNFDIPSPPDTKCKQEYDCKRLGNITYSDREGNIYCGKRYKQTKENNPYHWEYKECHALLEKARPKDKQKELPF